MDDLESFVNKSLTDWQCHDYQKDMLTKISKNASYGNLSGVTCSYGRQTGKSTWTVAALQKVIKDLEALVEPTHEVLTTAQVDGKPWYTISCRKEVSMWIRENGTENVEWFEHIDGNWRIHKNMFDVSQEMLSMIKLRWS